MNRIIPAGIALMLALIVAATGCNKASDGAVLAKVNNGAITATDFKQQVDELAPQMRQAVMTDPKARKEFLEDLIGIELVLQEAKRQGLDKDADFKKKEDAMRKELERRIQEERKNELFNSVLKKDLGDKMAKVTPPTDKEVRDYFDANKEKILAAVGKKVALKDIEPQLKMRMMQEKRRDIYLEYSKSLKEKAKISIDDKAVDTLIADMSKPSNVDLSNIKVQPAPKKEEAQK
ncbi:MAG TPA: SurA N-terminal domain-containing protein [Nitrospirota bacterium]|nr:SurA N-terminal domain-containing protein [Nitrospirota bacterium]